MSHKLLALASLALLAHCASEADAAPAYDTWTGSDKVLHAAVGAGTGLIIYGIAEGQGFAHPRAAGFAAGCGLGIAKEAMDSRFSSKDAVVTCLGAAAGAYLGGVMVEYHRQSRITTVTYKWGF